MSPGSACPGVPYALRTTPSPSRMLWPVIPCWLGNVPVPIEACAHAVTAGNDPTIALRKFAPSPISRLQVRPPVGEVARARSSRRRRSRRSSRPSASSPTVTSRSGATCPRRSSGQSAPIRAAVVGARSARVTRSSESEAHDDARAVHHQGDPLQVHPDARVARARVLRHQGERLERVVRAVERGEQQLQVAGPALVVRALHELHVLGPRSVAIASWTGRGIGAGGLAREPPPSAPADERPDEPAEAAAHRAGTGGGPGRGRVAGASPVAIASAESISEDEARSRRPRIADPASATTKPTSPPTRASRISASGNRRVVMGVVHIPRAPGRRERDRLWRSRATGASCACARGRGRACGRRSP